MKPDKEPGLLEAIFDIDPGRESLLEELMAPVPARAQRKARRRRRKRPWRRRSWGIPPAAFARGACACMMRRCPGSLERGLTGLPRMAVKNKRRSEPAGEHVMNLTIREPEAGK